MIQYWGTDSCEACKKVMNWLLTTPFEFEYLDVATTNFDGMIPRLVLEDGTHIIGPEQVKAYARNWLKQRGMMV